MAFTLAQFQLILAIHEHGSLGKASQVLRVTQPALSRTLRELERQLGVQMFERHPSGLRPTQYCLAVLPYAANSSVEAARALEEVRVLTGESQEVVRIGAIASAAASICPPLVSRILDSSPGVCVEVTEGVDEVLIQGLVNHEIDLIISATGLDRDDISKVHDLGHGDICTLLVSSSHPLLANAQITPTQLFEQPWVMLPRDAILQKRFMRLVSAQGLTPPRPLVETRSVNLIRELVAEQGYITWAPAPLYITPDSSSNIVELKLPQFELRRAFYVYRLRHATMSGAANRALSILRNMSDDVPFAVN